MKNFFLLVAAATLITITACKKNKDERPACKLTTITPNRGDITNIYYDSQNRLKTIRRGSSTITLEYKADSLIALETRGSSFYQKMKCKLNTQGLPITIRHEADQSGSTWFQTDLEYNGTELTKTTWFAPPNIRDITNYTWNNGNMVSRSTAVDSYEYEYFTDRSIQSADAYFIETVMPELGIQSVRNKNLLKKLKYTRTSLGSYTYFYEYQFDKDGKVLKIIRTTGEPNEKIEWDMQYQCD